MTEAKKRIIRTVIDEIIVSRDQHELVFVVHWAGGVHTQLRFDRPAAGSHFRTSKDAIEVIRKLAPRYDDNTIAAVLGINGMTTGRGNKWNKSRVRYARYQYGINPDYNNPESLGLLTLKKAMRYCGVCGQTIHKLIKAGLVTNEQTGSNAPMEIRKADLDSAAVQEALRRLRANGRLWLRGESANCQTELFK